MKWSKVRKNLKEYICDDLKNIIDLHMTGYHNAHDGVGEAYITINKQKIFGGGYYLSLTNNGILDIDEIVKVFFLYPNLKFEDLLETNNQLLKAFMIVDRRLGKRRFGNLKIFENDSDLVKLFYNLRRKVFYNK